MSSSVLVWPDARAVDEAVRRWATEAARARAGVRRIGYFGSYARGDWGVGSDVDILVVVTDDDLPFERRAAGWDLTALPVPAELLVYTTSEWRSLDAGSRFYQTVIRETVWVYLSPDEPERLAAPADCR